MWFDFFLAAASLAGGRFVSRASWSTLESLHDFWPLMILVHLCPSESCILFAAREKERAQEGGRDCVLGPNEVLYVPEDFERKRREREREREKLVEVCGQRREKT